MRYRARSMKLTPSPVGRRGFLKASVGLSGTALEKQTLRQLRAKTRTAVRQVRAKSKVEDETSARLINSIQRRLLVSRIERRTPL